MENLERRVQNLESFMSTQVNINENLLDLIIQTKQESSRPRDISFEEYSRGINKRLEDGNLQEALNFAASVNIKEGRTLKQKDALKKIKAWLKKQKWDMRKGKYTIAVWFEIQPILVRDIDGKELCITDTLLLELPLLTLPQAYSLIRHNYKELTVWFTGKN